MYFFHLNKANVRKRIDITPIPLLKNVNSLPPPHRHRNIQCSIHHPKYLCTCDIYSCRNRSYLLDSFRHSIRRFLVDELHNHKTFSLFIWIFVLCDINCHIPLNPMVVVDMVFIQPYRFSAIKICTSRHFH